ncbi:MAG: LacI family DNA-binding transcriptional regulator [Clostridia bacterium]|nr:LacI family DNA-binding transcriptional regulator [Clostridia bacterium]
MATIKDVAALAGVSTSTVSFVLNGKAQQMKVSDETAKKVQEAAARLDYRPSSAARRLRKAIAERPIIALYWPIDSRISYASLILDCIRIELERQEMDCDLVIRGYRSDHLNEQRELEDPAAYSVAIVGATGTKDSAYIDTLNPALPIILFNRKSERFSNVQAEEESAIRDAAQLLSDKGIRRPALIRCSHSYIAYNQRYRTLAETLSRFGIDISNDYIISAEDRYESGASAARQLLKLKKKPDALITMTDTIALGASYVLTREGIRIPEDLQILSFAIGDPALSRFATPSLSVIEMPTKTMAETAASMAIHRIRSGIITVPESHRVRNRLILRESCPE